jgi:hypothetical protein
MSKENLEISVDDFLFGRGLRVEDYFIEQTPVSEMLCYRNAEGRNFDLPINDERLAAAAIARLRELGVRVVTLG